eukprot:gene28949-37976_t
MPADSKSKARKSSDAEGGNSKKKSKHSEDDREEEEHDDKSESEEEDKPEKSAPKYDDEYEGNDSGLKDIFLNCKDCDQEFVFSVGEQEFYQSKGFDNQPVRCKPCKDEKKARMDGGGGVEIVIEEVSVVSVTRVVVAEVVAGQEEEVVEGTEADMVTEETEIEEAEGAEVEVVMVIVMVEVEGVEAVVCAMPFRRVIAREEAPVDSAIIRLSEELVSSG